MSSGEDIDSYDEKESSERTDAPIRVFVRIGESGYGPTVDGLLLLFALWGRGVRAPECNPASRHGPTVDAALILFLLPRGLPCLFFGALSLNTPSIILVKSLSSVARNISLLLEQTRYYQQDHNQCKMSGHVTTISTRFTIRWLPLSTCADSFSSS